MRTTLGDVRLSRIPPVLGVCATDPRVAAYVNEATQRLLPKGHWWGSYAHVRICATEGCLTMPPQIAAIERASICGQAIRVHDQWYQFLENGFGIREQLASCSSSGSNGDTISRCGGTCFGMGEALQRGTFPTFRDIRGTNKKLTIVCDLPGDVGKEILLLGYDENGNWIRTDQGGVVRDGEILELDQSAGTTSTHLFSALTDIQILEEMDGQWWLYEFNTDTALLTMLGHYQYFERRPNYQRYFFPSILQGTDSEDNCTLTKVDCMVKLDYVPVKNDTDYCLIASIPALKEMSRSIMLSEKEPDYEKAERILMAGEKNALRELDAELDHYLGQRNVGIDIVGPSVGSAQVIEQFL